MKQLAIIGLQYGGHDTSACLLRDGKIIAACEQERYTLDKHSRRFPSDAINDCLKLGGLNISDIDRIAVCGDINYYIREAYLRPAIDDDRRLGFLINDIRRIEEHYNMSDKIRDLTDFTGTISYHRHHICHLASAFYPSGFQRSLLASYDGVGEIESSMLGLGIDGAIELVEQSNRYPHSLGLLYTAITYYLGFIPYCDEGIVMGLAPYGDPKNTIPGSTRTYQDLFNEILTVTGDYGYKVDQSWFKYYDVRDTWISEKFVSLLGPKRKPKDIITQHHKDIAAALQDRLEDIVLAQLQAAKQEFKINNLCLAGGVALNCSLNGKIEQARIFKEIFVQPASGDSGTSIGAAYLAFAELGGRLKQEKSHNFYLGSEFSGEEIVGAFEGAGVDYQHADDIAKVIAVKLAEGKIVAWFQGRAEFGPRALGNRSILTRPYPAEMRDYLNQRVKFREEFRPFAPAVLAEHCGEYFSIEQQSPHMLIACKAKPERRSSIDATVHVDGTCRVQTVSCENNSRFRSLLEEFYKITGVPVLLNTSFNVKGQPIVNTPSQAVECFSSTNIDVLVVGDYYTEKHHASQ